MRRARFAILIVIAIVGVGAYCNTPLQTKNVYAQVGGDGSCAYYSEIVKRDREEAQRELAGVLAQLEAQMRENQEITGKSGMAQETIGRMILERAQAEHKKETEK